MKRYLLFVLIFLASLSAHAQVGIGTTNPSSTLDVNGTVRMRGVKSSLENDVNAIRVVGIDSEGNLVEVEIDDNIILENNRLRATYRKVEIGTIPLITVNQINNLAIIILPGEPNESKSVIRLESVLGNMELTGIEAAADGTVIWLYPTSGSLKVRTNNGDSLPSNQIEGTGSINVDQYAMIQLMYDATLGKWVIMSSY